MGQSNIYKSPFANHPWLSLEIEGVQSSQNAIHSYLVPG